MMNKLYFLPIDETMDQETFNILLSFISKEKQDQVNRFQFDIDKKLSLYTELLVRIIACQTLGIKNEEIIFEKGEYGKPYIRDYTNFHYNVSHTRNAIVVVVSDKSIGVDIEKIKTADMQIANRFFTTSEQEYIKEFSSKEDKRFYEVWTKKEAYIKFIGKGLSMPLNSFDVLDSIIYNKMQTFEIGNYIISSYGNNTKFDKIEIPENKFIEIKCIESWIV